MQQEILDDAQFDKFADSMEKEGKLLRFVAVQTWKQGRILSRLPCLTDKSCPITNQSRFKSATKYAGPGGIGFGIASVIYWLIQFLRG